MQHFMTIKILKGGEPLLPNAPDQPNVHPKTTKFGTLRISSNYLCSKNVSCLPPTQTIQAFALKFLPKEVSCFISLYHYFAIKQPSKSNLSIIFLHANVFCLQVTSLPLKRCWPRRKGKHIIVPCDEWTSSATMGTFDCRHI